MRRLFFPNSLWYKTPMLKLQAIYHDGSVGLEFMTDDASAKLKRRPETDRMRKGENNVETR
jgi:hypothetical protein